MNSRTPGGREAIGHDRPDEAREADGSEEQAERRGAVSQGLHARQVAEAHLQHIGGAPHDRPARLDESKRRRIPDHNGRHLKAGANHHIQPKFISKKHLRYSMPSYQGGAIIDMPDRSKAMSHTCDHHLIGKPPECFSCGQIT